VTLGGAWLTLRRALRGLGTRSDVVEMLNRTDVLLNNEQADAKTLSIVVMVL